MTEIDLSELNVEEAQYAMILQAKIKIILNSMNSSSKVSEKTFEKV